jgi:hypothetical protein
MTPSAHRRTYDITDRLDDLTAANAWLSLEPLESTAAATQLDAAWRDYWIPEGHCGGRLDATCPGGCPCERCGC